MTKYVWIFYAEEFEKGTTIEVKGTNDIRKEYNKICRELEQKYHHVWVTDVIINGKYRPLYDKNDCWIGF